MSAPAPSPDTAAPGEVYRDPVYDGATDPLVVEADGSEWMFYTQRRATHPSPGPGVSWVHGSRVGVARLVGGVWTYVGTLEPTGASSAGLTLRDGPPPADVDRTHWAPEIVHDGERWRMYLTEIDGVPDRWDGHPRRIVEYASDDLCTWERRGPLPLASDRVIDAAAARCPDGRWRLWYKDEAAGSVTRAAVSDDLSTWHDAGIAIPGRPHEGPVAFALGGWWWLLTDEWRGMAVYRSRDAVRWRRQGDADAVILGESGSCRTGVQVGRHGSVAVHGDTATLTFFSHPWWDGVEIEDMPEAQAAAARRSAVHTARLHVTDGVLECER